VTEEQLLHLLGYIGVVRASLRMQNWDVILLRTPHGIADTWAYTWISEGHYTINIEICPELLTESPEVIRNAVVHELIHAQHWDIDQLWENYTQHNNDVTVSQSRSGGKDYLIQMERFMSWTTKQVEKSVPMYIPRSRGRSRPSEYDTPEGCYLHD
jgi:hypothetical protein